MGVAVRYGPSLCSRVARAESNAGVLVCPLRSLLLHRYALQLRAKESIRMGATASVEAAQAALRKDIDDFNAAYGEIVAPADGKTPTERLVELRRARDDLLLSARQAIEPASSNNQKAPDFGASKESQLKAEALNEEEKAIVQDKNASSEAAGPKNKRPR